ncbi:hypothetical protein [Streptomyces erythrochromogenes]|uniref:hypothetical protein n=1 Tax=Streptomyces erythrochromogenes TaxID=285574 RepID=UPI0037FCBE2C
MRYTRLAVATAVGALLLAGCADSEQEDIRTDGRGSVVRDVVTEADIVLPVSAYFFTPEQQAVIDTAISALASDCMKRFGFDRPAKKVEPVKMVDRRYGVVSEKIAIEYGYHVIPSAAGDVHADGTAPSGSKLPPEAYMVYGGKGGTENAGRSYQGQDVPEGGCKGEATRRLGLDKMQDPAKGNVGLLGINFSSFGKAQNMSEFTKAQDEWIACMKKEGHQYTAFLQPAENYASQGSFASPEEKAVAKVDVRCKQEVKLDTVLLRLETQIQTDYIEQNAAGFAEIKENQDAVIKSANQALAN